MSGFRNPARWFTEWVLGESQDSQATGKHVSDRAALGYAPIWYGVTKIAGHIGQLPIGVFRRVDGGGERMRSHSVARIMRKPNAYQTPSVFREQLATHSLLDGNGRAAIVRAAGQPTELIPLHPSCTVTGMLDGIKLHATRPGADDRLRRFFPDVNGNEDGDGLIMLDDSEVVHIVGLSVDGVCGLPLREIARRNLNAAINTEERFAKSMAQGFSGSLMLEAPAGVFRNESDAREFLHEFENRHNSPDKAGKPGLLREGMKANILAASNREAEMIDNRKFQRQDAALWLGLEQILGDDSSVSYNSLEQKNLAYLMNCLNRWLKRWEEEVERKLLPSRQFDGDTHYVRFNTGALLKSDYQTAVESLATGLQATIISRNEAREKLDMLPVEGGDTFENPAITPGHEAPPSELQTDPEETAQTEPATGNESAAVRARLEHLIGVEAKRIQQAAAKATSEDRNFLEWVDSFYAKWEPKLADWLEDLDIDRGHASEYCRESKERLLELADYSNNDTLADNVNKATASWPVRAGGLILGETIHV